MKIKPSAARRANIERDMVGRFFGREGREKARLDVLQKFAWRAPNAYFCSKLLAMSTIQHINAYLESIPAQLQIQVLRYIESLVPKKAKAAPISPQRTFRFIGMGNSMGAINQVENLRDFAYDA